MPSVTYMNQSAPFWDWVASLEQQGQSHPFFSQSRESTTRDNEEHPFGFRPWGWNHPWGSAPGRSQPDAPSPDQPAMPEDDNEKRDDKNDDTGEGQSKDTGSDSEGCARRRGRHNRCGEGRRDHHGPGHARHHGHHRPHGRGGHGHGRRGGWGPWGGRGGPFNPVSFAAGLFGQPAAHGENEENQDFSPEADVFDTPSAFVIHISLPGAKKEDVGVNWDAEKSELSVAGVIYRPGDEEFLKTLSMEERKVGPFERKIRLGTRATPAQIDDEGISAKLEDGVLRVTVPKLEMEFVEVRKVDIE